VQFVLLVLLLTTPKAATETLSLCQSSYATAVATMVSVTGRTLRRDTMQLILSKLSLASVNFHFTMVSNLIHNALMMVLDNKFVILAR